MKKIMAALLMVAMLALLPAKASLAGYDSYIGEITIFAGNFAPHGYEFCDGRLLRVDVNQALFSLLGNRFGGDGRTTFALPNLKAAEASLGGARYIIAVHGIYPPRD